MTHDELIKRLHYDPSTGIFTWIDAGYNKTRLNGKPAGSITNEGYIRIILNKVEYRAARLAWFYVHKEFPKEEIDHINRIRTDNRIENLRDVPRHVNSANTTPRVKTSGLPLGVWYNPKKRNFRICVRDSSSKTGWKYYRSVKTHEEMFEIVEKRGY